MYSSGAADPDHTWVSAFATVNTGSNLDAGELAIGITGASAFKPETTFKVKIEVSNAGGLDPTPISFEFDVTIVDFCRDSALSFDASQADEVYTINALASGTAASSVTMVGVSTDTDDTRCPITRTLEI